MTIAEALGTVERQEQTFGDLLQALHESHYTGAVVLHVVNGAPKVVELPARQIRLATSHAEPSGRS